MNIADLFIMIHTRAHPLQRINQPCKNYFPHGCCLCEMFLKIISIVLMSTVQWLDPASAGKVKTDIGTKSQNMLTTLKSEDAHKSSPKKSNAGYKISQTLKTDKMQLDNIWNLWIPGVSDFPDPSEIGEAGTGAGAAFEEVLTGAIGAVVPVVNAFGFGLPLSFYNVLSKSDTKHQYLKILRERVLAGWILFVRSDRLLRYLKIKNKRFCKSLKNGQNILQIFEEQIGMLAAELKSIASHDTSIFESSVMFLESALQLDIHGSEPHQLRLRKWMKSYPQDTNASWVTACVSSFLMLTTFDIGDLSEDKTHYMCESTQEQIAMWVDNWSKMRTQSDVAISALLQTQKNKNLAWYRSKYRHSTIKKTTITPGESTNPNMGALIKISQDGLHARSKLFNGGVAIDKRFRHSNRKPRPRGHTADQGSPEDADSEEIEISPEMSYEDFKKAKYISLELTTRKKKSVNSYASYIIQGYELDLHGLDFLYYTKPNDILHTVATRTNDTDDIISPLKASFSEACDLVFLNSRKKQLDSCHLKYDEIRTSPWYLGTKISEAGVIQDDFHDIKRKMLMITIEHFNEQLSGISKNKLLFEKDPFKTKLNYHRYRGADNRETSYRWILDPRAKRYFVNETEEEFDAEFDKFIGKCSLIKVPGDELFSVFFDNLIFSEKEGWTRIYKYLFSIWRYVIQPFSYLFFGSTFCGPWSAEFYDFGKLIQGCFNNPSHDIGTVQQIYTEIAQQLRFSEKKGFPFMKDVAKSLKQRKVEANNNNKGWGFKKIGRSLKNIYYRQDPNLINAMLARKMAQVSATSQELITQLQIHGFDTETYCKAPPYFSAEGYHFGLGNNDTDGNNKRSDVINESLSSKNPYYFPIYHTLHNGSVQKITKIRKRVFYMKKTCEDLIKLSTYAWVVSCLSLALKEGYTKVTVTNDPPDEINTFYENFDKLMQKNDAARQIINLRKGPTEQGLLQQEQKDTQKLKMMNSEIEKSRKRIEVKIEKSGSVVVDIGTYITSELLRFDPRKPGVDLDLGLDKVGLDFLDQMLKFRHEMWSQSPGVEYYTFVEKESHTDTMKSEIEVFLSNIKSILTKFSEADKTKFIHYSASFIELLKDRLNKRVGGWEMTVDAPMEDKIAEAAAIVEKLCEHIQKFKTKDMSNDGLLQPRKGKDFYQVQDEVAKSIMATREVYTKLHEIHNSLFEWDKKDPYDGSNHTTSYWTRELFTHPLYTKWMKVDSSMTNIMSIINEAGLLTRDLITDAGIAVKYPFTFSEANFASTVSIDELNRIKTNANEHNTRKNKLDTLHHQWEVAKKAPRREESAGAYKILEAEYRNAYNDLEKFLDGCTPPWRTPYTPKNALEVGEMHTELTKFKDKLDKLDIRQKYINNIGEMLEQEEQIHDTYHSNKLKIPDVLELCIGNLSEFNHAVEYLLGNEKVCVMEARDKCNEVLKKLLDFNEKQRKELGIEESDQLLKISTSATSGGGFAKMQKTPALVKRSNIISRSPQLHPGFKKNYSNKKQNI